MQRGGKIPRFAITAAFMAASGMAAIADSLPPIHLVDDRMQAIGEPLELCFQLELKTDCRRISPGETVHAPDAFHGVRIEGESYGPVRLRREALPAQADGSFRIPVPRKALLHLEAGSRKDPLTVSLYDPQDPTFREPTFRAQLQPGNSEVKVPAGEFIASLTQARDAPDLQRLSAQPAARVRLTYRSRQGWSLLARCRDAASLQPVGRAEVQVTETIGYGQPEWSIAKVNSGADGLVLFSGLGSTMTSLAVRHPDFISSEVRGLTASPGTFTFREVDLGLGGRLNVHVTVHGRPLTGARCQIFSLAPNTPDPREPYRQLWEGSVNQQGLCRSDRLAQGVYKLRVQIPDSTSRFNRWVTVPEAQDVEVDVALAPTRVSGVVRRGGKPSAGYSVEALMIDSAKPKGAFGDVFADAISDEEGQYELTLWTPGWYSLHVRSASKIPAASHKELLTDGDEEKRMDFDLEATAFRGVVVDEAKRPVPGSRVVLRWQGVMLAEADAEGRFEIDVEGEGTGTLFATKAGYRDSETIEVLVEKDVSITPVTLVLKRKGTVRGRVLSANGDPLANAWIGSAGVSLERGPFLFSATRSGPDGSFEVDVPPGPPRVFISGPACPLSWFDLPATAERDGDDSERPTSLRCPGLPAALELTLVDSKGKPLPHAGIILRRQGMIVPQKVLTTHSNLLGLASDTDGAGHLVLAGLAPGDYELFLNVLCSESTIAAGSRRGYITTVSLPALQTTELQLTLPGLP
jgi:hypothetical protein